MRIHLTDQDCLHVLEAREKEGTRRVKWAAVYKNLPHNLRSRMTLDEIKIGWYNLSCEVEEKRKIKRSVGNISQGTLDMVKKYKEVKIASAAPTAPRKHCQQNTGRLHEVKSDGPYRSSKRVKVDKMVNGTILRSDPDEQSQGVYLISSFLLRLKDMVLDLQNEAGLHGVDEKPSKTFIECYDKEASELAQSIANSSLQTGRERILDKIEQELGIQRFNALLDEELSRSGTPIDSAFSSALAKFRKSIIYAVQSSIETLADDVIKVVAIKELRKEK